MNTWRHPRFDKHFKSRILPHLKLAKQFENRLQLFTSNPKHSLLKDHQLKGRKRNLRAFSVTGDIRVVYQRISEKKICLLDIGSHNQIY